jgi:DNA-binding Xre family transcriptional regulator
MARYSREVDVRPRWGIEVDKVLAERRMTKKSLAAAIGVSVRYLCAGIQGQYNSPLTDLRDKVCSYLGIELDEEVR